MSYDSEAMWEEFGATLPAAERINLTTEFEAADHECALDCEALLKPWIALTDESLRFVFALLKLSEEAHGNFDDRAHSSGFLMLLARSISLLRGIHILVARGLEDAARPVARRYLRPSISA